MKSELDSATTQEIVRIIRRAQGLLLDGDCGGFLFGIDRVQGYEYWAGIGPAFLAAIRGLLDIGSPSALQLLGEVLDEYDAVGESVRAARTKTQKLRDDIWAEASRLEIEAMQVECPHCGEPKGLPCLTSPGRKRFVHSDGRRYHGPRLRYARSLNNIPETGAAMTPDEKATANMADGAELEGQRQ